ncbi:MAG: DUF4443 domain-containing protein [Promethearchaeota archaeon]
MLSLKEEYEKIVPKNKMSSAFGYAHVVLALLQFRLHGHLGRVQLSSLIGLGRGSLRTFMNRLKLLDLIKADSTRAHSLTQKGKEYVTKIEKEFTLIGNLPAIFNNFMLGKEYNSIGRLSTAGYPPGHALSLNPLMLLDVAKKNGAHGLLTFVALENKDLELLSVKMDVKKTYKKEWIKLNELFSLAPGDVILISSADKELSARIAVIAAAVLAKEIVEKQEKNDV